MAVEKQSKSLVVEQRKPGCRAVASQVFSVAAISSATFVAVIVVVTVVALTAPSPLIDPEKNRLAYEASEEFAAPSRYVLAAYSTTPGEIATDALDSPHPYGSSLTRANGGNVDGGAETCGRCSAATPNTGARLKSGLRTTVAYLETDGGRNVTIAICAIVSALAAILTLRLKRAEFVLTREQTDRRL